MTDIGMVLKESGMGEEMAMRDHDQPGTFHLNIRLRHIPFPFLFTFDALPARYPLDRTS